MFHIACVHIIFKSISVTELPRFGKKLLTRLTICYLCILTNCNIRYSHFGFGGWIWVLIASVADICILFSFYKKKKHFLRTAFVYLQ